MKVHSFGKCFLDSDDGDFGVEVTSLGVDVDLDCVLVLLDGPTIFLLERFVHLIERLDNEIDIDLLALLPLVLELVLDFILEFEIIEVGTEGTPILGFDLLPAGFVFQGLEFLFDLLLLFLRILFL